jgi:hypothetical protein
MKTAALAPRARPRSPAPLRVNQVPPSPGASTAPRAELPGQGQRLFQLFRLDLMRAFGAKADPHA